MGQNGESLNERTVTGPAVTLQGRNRNHNKDDSRHIMIT